MKQALQEIPYVVCLLLVPHRLAFTLFVPECNKESIKEIQVLVDSDLQHQRTNSSRITRKARA